MKGLCRNDLQKKGPCVTVSPNHLMNWYDFCFLFCCFYFQFSMLAFHIDNPSRSSPLAPQNVFHSSPPCHLGVRGAGGLPSPPALDPGLGYPGVRHPWQPRRKHLSPSGAGVLILSVGGESRSGAAVWQVRGPEVCAGQQTPQGPTGSGEDFFD